MNKSTDGCLILALAAALLSPNSLAQHRRRARPAPNPPAGANPAPGSHPPAGPAPASNTDSPTGSIGHGAFTNVQISYRLDPRITASLNIGERWITSPTYAAAQDGKSIIVEARVYGLDAQGNSVGRGAQWIPEDSGMVSVGPGQASNSVHLTVHRAGESRLQVIAGGISRELAVKATYQDGIIRVEFTQNQ